MTDHLIAEEVPARNDDRCLKLYDVIQQGSSLSTTGHHLQIDLKSAALEQGARFQEIAPVSSFMARNRLLL